MGSWTATSRLPTNYAVTKKVSKYQDLLCSDPENTSWLRLREQGQTKALPLCLPHVLRWKSQQIAICQFHKNCSNMDMLENYGPILEVLILTDPPTSPTHRDPTFDDMRTTLARLTQTLRCLREVSVDQAGLQVTNL